MKKLFFAALVVLVGCVGKAPDRTLRAVPNQNIGGMSVCDPSTGYCLPVTDAGLPTTATLTGSVTVGTVGQGAPNSSANAWPVALVDSGVSVSNFPALQHVSVDNDSGNPVPVVTTPAAPYASVSQWWATAGSGTVKEAGATLFALSCTNLNTYGAWIQVFNQVTTPATDTGALAQWYVPANGEVIVGTDDLTAAGISLTNGLSWGMSTVTQFYNATAVSPNCNFTYK